MYTELQNINCKPEIFTEYTALELWNDTYTSERMLGYHLNKDIDVSSRKHGFIAESVEWIARRFELGAGRSVCDFGSAVGLYTTALARTGARVCGIDFSERSVAYARNEAREAGLSIEYHCMNYLDFTGSGEYDLITMIMCDYSALSPLQRRKLLKIFYESLKPGAEVLLDVYSLAAFAQVAEGAYYARNQLDGFWSAGDYYAFVNTFRYAAEEVGLDKYTIVEPERVRTIYNWLQYFSVESLSAEVAESGFEIAGVYGDVAGHRYSDTSSEFAVILKKV